MIVLIPASKVLQPAIEPIQCTARFNNKQIQYYYRLLINGSPSSMRVLGVEEAAVHELLHTLLFCAELYIAGSRVYYLE